MEWEQSGANHASCMTLQQRFERILTLELAQANWLPSTESGCVFAFPTLQTSFFPYHTPTPFKMAAFTVTVASRTSHKNKATSSAFPMVIELPTDKTLASLKKIIHQRHSRLSPERQRLTTEDKKAIVEDTQTLEQQGVKNGDTLYVKVSCRAAGGTSIDRTSHGLTAVALSLTGPRTSSGLAYRIPDGGE